MQIDPNSITWDPAPSRPSRAPGVIQGSSTRRDNQERRADNADARANTTTAIAEQRLELAQQAESRQQEQLARDNARKDAGFDATEGERKAAAFLLRALGANSSYEGTGVGPRSLPGQMARDAIPNVENYFVSGDRQVADSAQDEFIAASLRQDSGAAIPDQELERQRRIYFPMPGDGPEAIEQKRQARLRAIAGLEQSSGRLLESTQAEWAAMSSPASEGVPKETSEQEEALASLAPANPQGGAPGFGDDGTGKPLVIVTDRGVEVLMRGTLADGEAGYAIPGETIEGIEGEPLTLDDSSFAGEAFDLYQKFKRDEELRGEGGFFDVAKSGITLGLLDEASGIGDVIGSALTGDFNVGENFERGKTLENIRTEQGRQNLGAAAIPAELLGAGGAIKIANRFGQARNALQSVRNSGQAVNRGSVQKRLVRNATVEGAGIGALAGGAQGDGLQERSVNALLGSATGGALGRFGEQAGNALANRAVARQSNTTPLTTGQEAAQAAIDEGIDVIPAVTRGSATKMLTSGARQGFISDIPINRAVDWMNSQGQAVRDRAAAATGKVLEGDDAGEIVRRGAEIYLKRTSQIGSRLFDRADSRAGNVDFPLIQAVRTARAELQTLRQAPGGADSTMGRELVKLIEQMGGRRVSVEGTRQLRTRLRNEIMQRGMRGSPEDRVYKKILDAADADMIAGLQAAGKDDAVQALRTANEFWKKRVETIDQVLDPLLGKNAPRSGEQILSSLERMAKPNSGNAANLRRLLEAMPKEEAASVRATVISRMGTPTKGSANMDQQGFSFENFLTSWNNMTPRARALIFPQEHVKSLNNLARIGVGAKEARNALNSSNTAGAIASQTAISGALAWALHPLAAAGAGLGQYGIGKLLSNPRFAKAVVNAPRNATPAQRKAFAGRLGNLAQAEPSIAREVQQYLKVLSSNDNTVGQLAAESGDQEPAN